MTYQKLYKTAREYRAIYEELQKSGFNGNLREEAAKRLGVSTAQGDRYGRFNKLIPDVQNLVRDYGTGMSSLLVMASHTPNEQKEIYEVLLDAWGDGVRLTRDFIKVVIDFYREGTTNWCRIKPHCLEFIPTKTSKRKNWHRQFNSLVLDEVRDLSGREFELWFAELLRKCRYTGVEVTQHSYDKGADVVAIKGGVRFIFQCKNSSNIGIAALQEIWFAKREIDNAPVVVTTGNIAASARRIAAERGIQCWTGEDLVRMISNDMAISQ